jgi:hypothetical protein
VCLSAIKAAQSCFVTAATHFHPDVTFMGFHGRPAKWAAIGVKEMRDLREVMERVSVTVAQLFNSAFAGRVFGEWSTENWRCFAVVAMTSAGKMRWIA